MSQAKTDEKKKQDTKKGKDKKIELKASEYEKLVQEAGEYKDKYLRLFAEFENARKRMDREKIDFVKYANMELMTDFLKVIDDLERSIEAAKAKHQDYSAFLKGIEIVMKELYDLLKKNDVQQIETVGKQFDPHSHEVLMQEETDEYDEGTITEEYQKGFKIGDQVVRTAKVKVAKNK